MGRLPLPSLPTASSLARLAICERSRRRPRKHCHECERARNEKIRIDTNALMFTHLMLRVSVSAPTRLPRTNVLRFLFIYVRGAFMCRVMMRILQLPRVVGRFHQNLLQSCQAVVAQGKPLGKCCNNQKFPQILAKTSCLRSTLLEMFVSSMIRKISTKLRSICSLVVIKIHEIISTALDKHTACERLLTSVSSPAE